MSTSRSHGTEEESTPPLDLGAMVRGDDAFPDVGYRATEEDRDDPYAPAASLRLRIGEDIDWSDVGGGAVLQRGDSTKGAGANPKSAARRGLQQQAAAPRSSMSAPTRKVAPVVIGGLMPPAAAGMGKVLCSPSPCRVGGRARVFAAGEQQQAVDHRHRPEEPGSPKVSCLGAVRPAGRGMSRRALWRSWFAARVTCCFSSHYRSAPIGNEADY